MNDLIRSVLALLFVRSSSKGCLKLLLLLKLLHPMNQVILELWIFVVAAQRLHGLVWSADYEPSLRVLPCTVSAVG